MQNLLQIGIGICGAEMAPAIQHMNLGTSGRCIVFTDANRSGMRPLAHAQRMERLHEAHRMRNRGFRADAEPAATFELVAQAGCRAGLQAGANVAQPMHVGDLAHCIVRRAPRAEHSVQSRHLRDLQVRGVYRHRNRWAVDRIPLQGPEFFILSRLAVVLRLQFLQPAHMPDQHAQLSRCCFPFHARDFRRCAPCWPPVAAEMPQHAGAKIRALSDMQRHIVLRVKRIHARRFRKALWQIGGQAGRQLRLLQLVCNRPIDCGVLEIPVYKLREVPQHARVGQRAVPALAEKAVALDQAVQVVPSLLRIKGAREPHGAQHIRGVLQSDAAEFILQEAIVETRVMRDQRFSRQAFEQVAGEFAKSRRFGHHGVGDTRQRLDHR